MVMLSRGLNQWSAVVLMAYLSAVIGGGLHHHDSAESVDLKESASEKCISLGQSRLVFFHDESDECTICVASSQAKATQSVVLLAETFLVLDEVLTSPIQFKVASLPFVTQARAPPPSNQPFQKTVLLGPRTAFAAWR
jgi:hypothetical protein